MEYIQVADIKAWYALEHPKTTFLLFTISDTWTSDVILAIIISSTIFCSRKCITVMMSAYFYSLKTNIVRHIADTYYYIWVINNFIAY